MVPWTPNNFVRMRGGALPSAGMIRNTTSQFGG